MSDIILDQPVRDLDPFSFFGNYASRIKPLGGPERGPDPRYGFHTLYFEYRPGPVVFTISFQDLAVSFGELHIHVNAFVPNSGSHASLVGSSRTQMSELSADGADISHRVNAIAGVTYAVFGYFPDGTDARASGVTITAQELGDIENSSVPAEAFEPSRFGSDTLAAARTLVDDNAPRFGSPVSQVMTAAQLTEDAFRQRALALPAGDRTDENAWRQAFVIEALTRYGMLKPGALGLAFADDEGLSALIAAQGCGVIVARDGGGENDDQPVAASFSVRAMNFLDQPDDLRGFDFLWSVGVANRLGAAEAAARFIEASMRALRPGGIAVHVFDMLDSAERRSFDHADRMPLHRKEVERIALTIISRNNDIAQLNFGTSGDDAAWAEEIECHTHDGIVMAQVTPFGLIARKG